MRRAEEMVRKSGQMGVPVIDIDGKIIVGFNKPEIEKYLHH
jgi:glutaredoxin